MLCIVFAVYQMYSHPQNRKSIYFAVSEPTLQTEAEQDLKRRLILPPRGETKQHTTMQQRSKFLTPWVDVVTKSHTMHTPDRPRWISRKIACYFSNTLDLRLFLCYPAMYHFYCYQYIPWDFIFSFEVCTILMQIQNLGFPPGLQDAVCCIFMKMFVLHGHLKSHFSIHMCYKTINMSFDSQKFSFKVVMCIIN